MTREVSEAARMLDAQEAMRAIAAVYEELLRRKGPAHFTAEDWRRIAEISSDANVVAQLVRGAPGRQRASVLSDQ